MAGYRPPLTGYQIELLRWVASGCPSGQHHGYAYRGSARTLAARGLLRVSGRGSSWSAAITSDGEYYLEHNTYAPPSRGEAPEAKPQPKAKASGATTQERSMRESKKPKASTYVRKTDVMMQALLDSPDHRIAIEREEYERYARLVSLAERKGLVPAGMTIKLTWRRQSDPEGSAVWLEPLPAWQTCELSPIHVADRPTDLTDVVAKLSARSDVKFGPTVHGRAMCILDALVRESRQRGYKVRAGQAPIVTRPVRRDEYVNPDRRGHLRIQIGEDIFQICLAQVVDQVAHIATKAEMARSGRGWGPPPEFDEAQSDRLELVLHGEGAVHWGSRWTDADSPLEESLARVMQEVELRHDDREGVRAKEAAQKAKAREDWERVRAQAIERFAADHRVHSLLDQVKQLRLVTEIREYAARIQSIAQRYASIGDREAALAWATWAADYADSIDPLSGLITTPATPEPTYKALAEYMDPWSPDGPYIRTRHVSEFMSAPKPESRSWWQDRAVPPWQR